MTADDLNRRLLAERIVPLAANEWSMLADSYEQLERHITGVAGDLLIVNGAAGIAAVEQPTPDQRVVRLLSDAEEVRRFVEQRMDEYERMWDGCGCKIDYFS